MGSPDRSKSDGVTDEVLAGEYVLGVLSAERRPVIEERIRADASFARIVDRWRDNLAAAHEEELRLSDALMRLSAPPRPLNGRAPGGISAAIWHSTTFWRIATLWSLLAAVMLSLG